MKAKTSDPNLNCFTFPLGYSLSLANTCTIDFVIAFTVDGVNNTGMDVAPTVP